MITLSSHKRSNNTVITSISSPVFSTAMTSGAQAALGGNLYSISLDPSTLRASSGLIEVNLQNPNYSQKTISLQSILIGLIIQGDSSNGIDIDFMRDGTFSGGSLLVASNRNFGSSKTSITTTKYVDNTTTNALSGATLIASFRMPIQTGQAIFNIQGDIDIPPAHSFTLKMANTTSTNAGIVSITMVWSEINQV